jgi:hypothetical protein
LLTAFAFYSRFRFIANLLPLLQRGVALRRVVTVAGGGLEGPLDSSDFPARRVPLTAIRGHLCTLISLGLESVAKIAPEVSFVHDFPGAVNTSLFDRMEGIVGVVMRAYIYLLGRWICVLIKECGERHLYFATSARFLQVRAGSAGVPLGDGADVACGTTGRVGSGVYSVEWDGASASSTVQKLLAGYRDKGMVEEIWQHTESEFKRITERDEGL